jgi:glycosyltransferase involved in cell wall biosynthesis
MKPIIVSTADVSGGAARAAYRLHKGMQSMGIESKMLVQEKYSDDWTVQGPNRDLGKFIAWQRRILDKMPIRLYPGHDDVPFHSAWLSGGGVVRRIREYDPNVVNLHWVSRGMLSIEDIRSINKPIVWTLQDMWAFTGGCHYDQDCGKYQDQCGSCPILKSKRQIDLSRVTWYRKHRAWRKLDMVIVAPTHWLADCARQSSLFADRQVEVIPFGLDLNVFKPIEKHFARDIFGFPNEKRIVLFGALYPNDPRKGFKYLEAALRILKSKLIDNDSILLAVFGSSEPIQPPVFPFPYRYLGKKKDDETLALLYSAADVMIVPSVQEAFGQTASEALACGTPVVTFDSTGPKDIVDHRRNGYLANAYSPEDLSNGISWILDHESRYKQISHHARIKAEQNFGVELQAQRYVSLFEEVESRRSVKDGSGLTMEKA